MKKFLFFFLFFITIRAFCDDYITQNIINGCGETSHYTAEFEPITYNCPSGQFLPAGAISCQQCPQTHTCPGGTFSFKANQTQGLSEGDILVTDAIGSCSPAFTQNYSAIFEPITYTCSSGYYLPAGEDWVNDFEGCRACLNDHYCPGGTYTFNETVDQGITACPSEHPFSPAGMWLSNQCGRKLHIGGNIIYLHQSPAHPSEHRLYINVNGNIYSANMTLLDIPMNILTEQKLKVRFENNTYSVFDDSMETNR